MGILRTYVVVGKHRVCSGRLVVSHLVQFREQVRARFYGYQSRGERGSPQTACESYEMKINSQVVVFDAADLTAESSFWAGLLGGTVDAEEDWHMVIVDGVAKVGVQLAPDHAPPGWPQGDPQQIHLDLWVDDIDAAHEEVTALGAKLLQEAADNNEPDNFQVYADPAGHPFCLCWIKE